MSAQRGFTIVELMVAALLGLFMVGAVIAIFVSNGQVYREQDAIARLQENSRFALAMMERDIRMTGYRGCLGRTNSTSIPTPVNNILANPTSFATNYAVSLEGHAATGATWSPPLDTTISAAVPPPAAGSDVITVRMGVGLGSALRSTMPNDQADIPVISIAAFPVGTVGMISDCVASTVFEVSGVVGQDLAHVTGPNAIAGLGRAFGTDAIVMPVATITYFVAQSSNAPTGTETSLWQYNSAYAPSLRELVEGVETMQIMFGEDSDGDLSPDNYKSADAVTDMNNVVAVHVSLLFKTNDNYATVGPQNYTFDGVTNIVAPDRRARRVFSTTISVRNRTK